MGTQEWVRNSHGKWAISVRVTEILLIILWFSCPVPDVNKQHEESTDMMRELLSLLNNSNPDGNSSSLIMTAIIQWLHDSPQTILLTPCIHSASRCLASLSHLTQIVEECIQMYFISGILMFLFPVNILKSQAVLHRFLARLDKVQEELLFYPWRRCLRWQRQRR